MKGQYEDQIKKDIYRTFSDDKYIQSDEMN